MALRRLTGGLVLGGWFSAAAASVAPPPAQLASIPDLSSAFGIWQPPIKGVPPLNRFQPTRSKLLLGRDCLANGTNYCFANNEDFCSNCGTCCSDSAANKWCCAKDGICCGAFCCASGQTCTNGQCFLPVVTVTVSSTIVTTVTHTLTNINTVVEAIVETSVVASIVEVTITNSAATETQWTYVTVTAAHKRSLPSPTTLPPVTGDRPESSKTPGFFERLLEACDVLLGGWCPWAAEEEILSSPLLSDTNEVPEQTNLHARQATKSASATAVTSIVTDLLTQTQDVTTVITSEITTTSVSTAVVTTFQTNTKVVSARTTVQATSTLTFTPAVPVTETITHTATGPTGLITASPTGNSDSGNSSGGGNSSSSDSSSTGALLPSTSRDPPSGLSTAAIAGIAVGSAVFALVAFILAFFAMRWRRRRRAERAASRDDRWDDVGQGYAPVRPPSRLPTLPHMPSTPGPPRFLDPAAPAAAAAVAPPPRNPHRQSQGQYSSYTRAHNRSSSGYTGSTAVGSTSSASASQINKPLGGGGSGRGSVGDDIPEMPADEMSERRDTQGSGPGPFFYRDY